MPPAGDQTQLALLGSGRPVSWPRTLARRACQRRGRAVTAALSPHRFPRSTDSIDSGPCPARRRPAELRLGIGRDCGETRAPGQGAEADGAGRELTSQRLCSPAPAPPFCPVSPVRPGSQAWVGLLSSSRSRGTRRAVEPSFLPRTQVASLCSKPLESPQRGLARREAGTRGGALPGAPPQRSGTPSPPLPCPAPATMGVWPRVSAAASSFASRSCERSQASSTLPGNRPPQRVPVSAAGLPQNALTRSVTPSAAQRAPGNALIVAPCCKLLSGREACGTTMR